MSIDERTTPRPAIFATLTILVLVSCAQVDEITHPITPSQHHFISDLPAQGDSLACGITGPWEDWSDIWRYGTPSCTLDAGLTKPTPGGTRAFGGESRVTVLLPPDTQWSTVSMRVRARPHPDPTRHQSVRLEVNEIPIETTTVATTWETLNFKIPDGALRRGENTVALRFSYGVSARDAGLGNSLRPIAANIKEIWFTRDGVAPLTWPQVQQQYERTLSDPSPTQIWDPDRRRFVAPTGGQLVFPVHIPAGATWFEFDIIPSPDLDLHASSISARIEDLDGRDRSIHEVRPSESASDLEAGTLPLKLPVGILAGRNALATIDLNPKPEGAVIEVAGFRIVSKSSRHTDIHDSADRFGSLTHPPDIVVITLDAARPDHCSCYGYHRPTTPVIDQFAEQSLVFSNAFALAPYTLCSVPTMITGLSFLDHGVVGHDDALSLEALTLAEALGHAGYRTTCFTATPNNSAAKGFDQGYDEFHELWTEAPGETFQDPHYVAGRVIEWLESVDDDRPLHLQVHFIPPHAPYAPAKPFNLFADPSYDGPCTGGVQSFDKIEHGLVPDTEGCVTNLIDLYDGNLRAVDDATGRLLAALKRRKGWQNTVVLITSDHGEAFLEHGRLTHNSTLFDEMLRVPFILHLPERYEDLEVDTDGLVTLADVTPTLLAAAGIRFSGPGDGISLLAHPGTHNPPVGRFFVARNSASDPLAGLRTLRWKVLLTSTGVGAVFDLAGDPGERHNLVFSNPRQFAGLGLMLTERIAQPPSITVAGESAQTTHGDRELLEALGYVQNEGSGQ